MLAMSLQRLVTAVHYRCRCCAYSSCHRDAGSVGTRPGTHRPT
jgi:hypothetical protein